MSDFLSQAVSILEQRFLKNAFLPVLLFFPAIFMPTLIPGGRLTDFIGRWDSQSATLKIVEVAGYLAIVWFVAAIVASQWRNIVRLYEGYPFAKWPLFYRLGTEWHRKQLAELQQGHQTVGSRFFNYWAYPEEDDVLPTRLGNVLRAAEMYSLYRYRADEILLWPRIYHILPRELLRDIDDARATLEFLLVVSLWCVGFAIGNVIVALLANGPLGLAAGIFAGGLVFAYLAYVSAIPAAAEYGAYIRTAFEAYRFDLLAQLRVPTPVNLADERRRWSALCAFILNGRSPAWSYEKAESEPLLRSGDIQSSNGADGARGS
jgi:hypothetical protein